jgi:hypothetical protein
MTEDLRKKIKSIIRQYMESGKADKLSIDGMQDIQRVIKKYGAESIAKSELKPLLAEVMDELQSKFLSEHLGEVQGDTSRSMQTIIDAGVSDSRKIDRAILNGVVKGINDGISGNLSWRDTARIALRRLNLADHHIETNINTVQAALDNTARVAQFKAADVAYLRYSGPAGTKRPFCMEHIGKVYTVTTVEGMLNGFGQKALIYCGGWGCRHRWGAVNQGSVTIEDGRKSKQHEIDTANALSNAGYDVVLKKESTEEGVKSFEGYVNDKKAEFKSLTNATSNEQNRAKLDYQEAVKQGGEHFVLQVTKEEANLDEINTGLLKALKWDISRKITTITIIRNGSIQTISRDDYEKGQRFF